MNAKPNRREYLKIGSGVVAGVVFGTMNIALGQPSDLVVNIEDGKDLKLVDVNVEPVEYEGKKALRVVMDTDENLNGMVIPEGVVFQNGTIELELAGKPKPGAPEFARGFIGLAFHVDDDDPYNHECFYLRPVNSIADNEAQRSHTVQYASHPDYPWNRLREENPGKYENFAEMKPGQWVKMKIEVNGTTARLFIGDAEEPCLAVNDLKHGGREGAIALWTHSTTEAYFRNLVIKKH